MVLSRRALLEEEARGRAVETRGKLVVGAVLPGVVTALKDFGAFVDVGGIEGLAAGVGDRLPARHAPGRRADRRPAGDGAGDARREARRSAAPRAGVVLAEGARARSLAGRRRAVARPARVVRGQVTRAEPFGAFVELAPGVEGLMHISELGAGKPLRHAREAVKPGDALEVAVLAIEPEQAPHLAGPRRAARTRVDDEGRAAAARASGGGGRHGDAGRPAQGQAARAALSSPARSRRAERRTVEVRAERRVSAISG